MPSNIEIKARARDFAALCRRAEALSDTSVEIIPQEDTFFNTPNGRLKLRRLAPDRAYLIYYERLDRDGPKRSDYTFTETRDPEGLKHTLASAYGLRGVVKKTRYLYLIGQTRVHLDEVEDLGYFMEVEVVLRSDQTDADGQAIAADLMLKLNVHPEDLLEGAYMDMLENRK